MKTQKLPPHPADMASEMLYGVRQTMGVVYAVNAKGRETLKRIRRNQKRRKAK